MIPLRSARHTSHTGNRDQRSQNLRETSLLVRNTSRSTGAQVASSMQKNATTLSSP